MENLNLLKKENLGRIFSKLDTAGVQSETDAKDDMEYNDRLDILKHLSMIHVNISNSITSDFVFAKLDPELRQFIIEMTSNAYFSRKILNDYANRAYDKGKVALDGRDYILSISNSIFNDYMNKIFMTVILHRNVSKNYIVDRLTGIETPVPGEPDKSINVENVKKAIRPEHMNEQQREGEIG